MSVNLTSSNESLLEPHSFSSSSIPVFTYCCLFGTSSFVYLSYVITNTCILLPLSIFILHHGRQQWKQKGSSSTTTANHLDYLTYHLVTMELIGVLASVVSLFVVDLNMKTVWSYIFDLPWFAEIFFHVLTCLERYLAVVHPITYLNLRTERGVRIRNVTIGFVWLFCCVAICWEMLKMFSMINLCLLVFSVTAVTYFSVSVLCVLIHHGPGKPSRGRERVDQSKQKAFNIILVILGVLVIKFTFNIIWELVYVSRGVEGCVILTCCSWFNLPCSLMLPLLFLHRAGRFVCHKNSRDPNEEQD